MAERLVRVGVPVEVANQYDEMQEGDWVGLAINIVAAKEVFRFLIDDGRISEDDTVDFEFRADPSVEADSLTRPVWVVDVAGREVGMEKEENPTLHTYCVPFYENNN